MAGGPYNIPRNTKGEIRYFNVFSGRALIETAIGALIGFSISYGTIHLIMSLGIKVKDSFVIELAVTAIIGFIGFAISSFKIPDSPNFEITRKAGGEYIDQIILRYIKFKRRKNKIYISVTEDEEDGK